MVCDLLSHGLAHDCFDAVSLRCVGLRSLPKYAGQFLLVRLLRAKAVGVVLLRIRMKEAGEKPRRMAIKVLLCCCCCLRCCPCFKQKKKKVHADDDDEPWR